MKANSVINPDSVSADGSQTEMKVDSARQERSTSGHAETRKQIRGSSLLVVGRFVSVLIACVTQILIVRYLSKTHYGAFEYALSVVAICETIITFGLDRAVARFIPIYDEEGDRARLAGTLILGLGGVLSFGSAIILLFYCLYSSFAHLIVNDHVAATLLLTMILLAPVQAMDNVLTGLFAVFASPRAIFFRKHLLGPGLRLVVVLMLISGKSGLYFLAGGYLISGVFGVLLYCGILYRAIKDRGLLTHARPASIHLPLKEVASFCAPILTSDIALTLLTAINTILLGYYGNAGTVAEFRVVQPTARLNQIVLLSFGLLLTPAASRMFARRDWQSLNGIYWQTAIWMSVLSFPIFVLTFSLAAPLTELLFGKRYIGSAPILAILSLGYYINAAFGANGTMLLVFGKVRYVVMTNITIVIVNLVLSIFLIPRYGPLGAAAAIGATLLVSNIIKQAGLRFCSGIATFEWRCLRVYGTIVACAVGLWAQAEFIHIHAVAFVSAAVASLLVLGLNRHELRVEETFPELLRFSLVRRFFGQGTVHGAERTYP